MDYLSQNVAKNLKRIRTSRGMSLDVAAEQTGVSKSMLAQIEKGTANPSLGVLGKITSGLRIEFQELISVPPMDSCLVDLSFASPVKEAPEQYKVWNIFPYEDNRLIELYRIEIEPGGAYVSGGHGEKTREYIAILHGVMTIETAGGFHDVTKKQVFRFETDRDHIYHNRGSETVSAICVFLDYNRMRL